jgi:hypothetical protein
MFGNRDILIAAIIVPNTGQNAFSDLIAALGPGVRKIPGSVNGGSTARNENTSRPFLVRHPAFLPADSQSVGRHGAKPSRVRRAGQRARRAKEIRRDAVITLNTLERVQSDYSCKL